jgi:peptidoglycan hydrolase-like protein with peptidoglycan-binding domain
MILCTSVGRGGANRADDTRLVQRLLNDARAATNAALLAVDGIVGPKTTAAIEEYQRKNALPTDGRVDPGGPTLKHLVRSHLNALESAMILPPRANESADHARRHDDLVSAAIQEYLKQLRSIQESRR